MNTQIAPIRKSEKKANLSKKIPNMEKRNTKYLWKSINLCLFLVTEKYVHRSMQCPILRTVITMETSLHFHLTKLLAQVKWVCHTWRMRN